MTLRYPGFAIIIILSSILGAVEGSVVCYIFSDFNLIWLGILLVFGLLFMGSLVGVYKYFKGIEVFTSNGINSRFPTKSYYGETAASREKTFDKTLMGAIKASEYSFGRKIKILKVVVDRLLADGKVKYTDMYAYLHSLDNSYQHDELRDALKLLSQPLLVIKQEKEEYELAISKHELRERLWMLSQIFLEHTNESEFQTKTE